MYSLQLQGRLLDLSEPVVMGILNVTPDSFYSGSRLEGVEAALRQAERMVAEGATLLDVGGMSTRPGAVTVTETAEHARVVPVVSAVAQAFPHIFISVDTWRATVAEAAVAAGASLINDISAGRFDPALYQTVARLRVPYVLMHMQGTPATMQQQPTYADVVQEVLDFFIAEVSELHTCGVYDVVLDPGFGFGKTTAHNFALLQHLAVFQRVLDLPVLAGVSRKSMIWKTLHTTPEHALNGTTALHMAALERGAHILRAHDVRAAVETIQLWKHLHGAVVGATS